MHTTKMIHTKRGCNTKIFNTKGCNTKIFNTKGYNIEGKNTENNCTGENNHIKDINTLGGQTFSPFCRGQFSSTAWHLIKCPVPYLLEACKDALQYIEQDEEAHGREFRAGIALRQAIKKAEN